MQIYASAIRLAGEQFDRDYVQAHASLRLLPASAKPPVPEQTSEFPG